MKRIKIQQIKNNPSAFIGKKVTIAGWIRSVRKQKSFSFIDVNDGSHFSSFQAVFESIATDYENILTNLTTGSCVTITGILIESPGKQPVELKAETIQILGSCPADEYPLQKKRHSFEFLRTIAHLRPRTNTGGAVARIRSQIALAAHKFFQERGFFYLQSPIITGSDCEGAGQLFQVTTLDLANLPKTSAKTIDYKQDFFDSPVYLTVSGQLNGEAFALALGDVYTFGPTFRAENSHTARHLAEFWMIEPEMAFAELADIKEIAEEFLKEMIRSALTIGKEDMEFFNQFIEKGVIDRLQFVLNSSFAHLTYSEAIQILKQSKKSFEFPIEWGCDLQSEHERYLAEEYCKSPLFITDYPKSIKAFYMRENSDGKTVAAMDVIVPKVGEIIGGSQREERIDKLTKKFEEHQIDLEKYKWYLDLRRYGSAPHGGFGVGFERLIQFLTGIENIREVSPFPRVPGHAEF